MKRLQVRNIIMTPTNYWKLKMCRLNEKCALRYSCQTQVNSTNRYITYIKGPGTDGSIKASAFKWKQDNALELEKVHYFLLNNRKILIRSVSSSDLWRGGSVGSGSWLLLRRPNLSSLGVLAGGPFAANLGAGHLAIHLKYRCNKNKEIYLQPLINIYIYTGLRIWYWPDPDPTSQDKPDPDPDPCFF